MKRKTIKDHPRYPEARAVILLMRIKYPNHTYKTKDVLGMFEDGGTADDILNPLDYSRRIMNEILEGWDK